MKLEQENCEDPPWEIFTFDKYLPLKNIHPEQKYMVCTWSGTSYSGDKWGRRTMSQMRTDAQTFRI